MFYDTNSLIDIFGQRLVRLLLYRFTLMIMNTQNSMTWLSVRSIKYLFCLCEALF